MAGFVYIMSNPAFPNLIKIGKSSKDPTTDRVNELNQTGVPEPFKVEYYAFVEDQGHLEQKIHEFYRSQRPNKNREFFSVDCAEAINTIRNMAGNSSQIKYEQVFFASREEIELARIEQEKEQRRQEEYQAIIKEQNEKAELDRINKARQLAAQEEYEEQKRKSSLGYYFVSFLLMIIMIFGFWALILAPPVGVAILLFVFIMAYRRR